MTITGEERERLLRLSVRLAMTFTGEEERRGSGGERDS